MAKNYDALHHIREQLASYDDGLSNAIQKLFDIEDQRKEKQGCVIDSVVTALLFSKFGVRCELHLGEMCADGIQDGYHCWLTAEGKIVDIGIYGNSNYNPLYSGEKLRYPIILEDSGHIKYADGSTEKESWIDQLSNKSVLEYINNCPQNRVRKLFCKALDIPENDRNFEMINDLAKNMFFPELNIVDVSPSGRKAHSDFC